MYVKFKGSTPSISGGIVLEAHSVRGFDQDPDRTMFIEHHLDRTAALNDPELEELKVVDVFWTPEKLGVPPTEKIGSIDNCIGVNVGVARDGVIVPIRLHMPTEAQIEGPSGHMARWWDMINYVFPPSVVHQNYRQMGAEKSITTLEDGDDPLEHRFEGHHLLLILGQPFEQWRWPPQRTRAAV